MPNNPSCKKNIRFMKISVFAVLVLIVLVICMFWKTWFIYPKYYAVVKQHLKDPGSANFRNSFFSKNDCFCGEFNSKNSAGGYVGFSRFVIQNNTVTIEGTELVGLGESYLDVMRSEVEIIEEQKSRAARGENVEYLSEQERRGKAIILAFDKTWARDCVK